MTQRPAAALALLVLLACSPEADRVRDGGPGADPGNKVLVEYTRPPAPRAADTTLWPGKAPAPVERFARGLTVPSTYPARTAEPPPTKAQQRTFDHDPSVNPQEPSSPGR